jgi:hypothetical protein
MIWNLRLGKQSQRPVRAPHGSTVRLLDEAEYRVAQALVNEQTAPDLLREMPDPLFLELPEPAPRVDVRSGD